MLLDSLLNVIDGFFLCRLSNHILSTKLSERLQYLPVGIIFFILEIRRIFFDASENSFIYTFCRVASTVLIFLIMMLLYNDSLKKKLGTMMLFFLIMMIVEGLAVCLINVFLPGVSFNEFRKNESAMIITSYFTRILIFFCIEWVCIRIKKKEEYTLSYGKELSFILVYNIGLFFALCYLLTTPVERLQGRNTIALIFSISSFLFSILSALLILKVAKRSKTELHYQLELQQMELEQKSNDELSYLIGQMRSFRHDIGNHFSVMSGLAKQGQYDDLEQYLEDISVDVEQMNRFILLENKPVAALINSKLAKADDNDIAFTFQSSTNTLPFSDLDLCGLLGNMLDNAIEACLHVKENPYIDVKISNKGSQYRICCVNPFEHEPVQKGSRFLTSKENKSIHGIGLQNIQHIVEKYNGELLINHENKTFTIEAILEA